MTDRCNLRCAHCYQGDRGSDPPFTELLAALEQFSDIVSRLSAERGTKVRGHISLTGGEPLVRADLFDLIREIKGAGHTFALLTNGTLVDDVKAAGIRALGPSYVQVSIDGREPTHDQIRGKGSYRQAVSGLRALRREGVRTMVSFTAHRGNLGELQGVARRMRALAVDKFWSDRMIPLGSGAEMAAEVLSSSDTRDYVRALGRARKNVLVTRHEEVAMDRALQFLSGGVPYRCPAGDSLLALLPDGAVYPCRRMPIPAGNLHAESLSSIYFGSKMLRELRDPERMDPRCRACSFGMVCHGGLRCMSYAITGDPFTADPGCWLANP